MENPHVVPLVQHLPFYDICAKHVQRLQQTGALGDWQFRNIWQQTTASGVAVMLIVFLMALCPNGRKVHSLHILIYGHSAERHTDLLTEIRCA